LRKDRENPKKSFLGRREGAMPTAREEELAKLRVDVSGMSWDDLEKLFSGIMANWAYCLGKWEEFKKAREEKPTMHNIVGVRDWLQRAFLAHGELGLCLERLAQIADEDIGKKEKFDSM